MPQFDIGTYLPQLIWLGISFSFLYIGVSRWLVPKVRHILEVRESYWNGYIEKTEALHQETEAIALKTHLQIEKAHADARDLLHLTTVRLRDEHQAEEAAFVKMLEVQIQEVESRIAAADKKAQAQLDPLAQSLAQKILEKLHI